MRMNDAAIIALILGGVGFFIYRAVAEEAFKPLPIEVPAPVFPSVAI